MSMDAGPLIGRIVEQIQRVNGVAAVVLGGSRARGTHTPESDIDLGIYYHPDHPLDLTALSRIATQLDDEHRPNLLTSIGGWGPRINGGGWLKIEGMAVDFLCRDLKAVEESIDDCAAGEVEIFHQPGHPFGFVSSTYMAEVALCRPLRDNTGAIHRLKSRTQPYPTPLKRALIAKFFWESDFSLMIARKAIPRADVSYAAGACFRAVGCMLQVLFAVNEQYWLNEKGAVALADTFPIRPGDLKTRVESAFELFSRNQSKIKLGIDQIASLVADVHALLSQFNAASETSPRTPPPHRAISTARPNHPSPPARGR
ncbi:MAG TPA: nucleotidyltransferase domain-containing protein [Tepidisphaeraceae bacterium]|jgi:predicted nucleotidyltransferase